MRANWWTRSGRSIPPATAKAPTRWERTASLPCKTAKPSPLRISSGAAVISRCKRKPTRNCMPPPGKSTRTASSSSKTKAIVPLRFQKVPCRYCGAKTQPRMMAVRKSTKRAQAKTERRLRTKATQQQPKSRKTPSCSARTVTRMVQTSSPS